MNKKVIQPERFKKPTIKATSRAYVRLFGYFSSPESWLDFLKTYQIRFVSFGNHRDGDCAIRVIDINTGADAILGMDIPNYITYHNYTATARSFWHEHFLSGTQRRRRVFEVGYANASTDEFFDR